MKSECCESRRDEFMQIWRLDDCGDFVREFVVDAFSYFKPVYRVRSARYNMIEEL